MKSLKVTSIGEFGEQSVSHPLPTSIPEDAAIVATISGVIKAGHMIKAFEIVEA